jgi:hypothetical protein
MDSKHNKCVFPLLGGNNHGGYRVLRKVWIERFNRIPSMIELVRKTSKTDDKQKTHKQQSMEALAYPCKHPSVNKLLTIRTKTMEAYTLWWNGGTFWRMLDYNTKYSPITNSHSYDILGARMLWKPKEARILTNFIDQPV